MRYWILGLAALGLAGCAGTTVRPVAYEVGRKPDHAKPAESGAAYDQHVDGLRYYEGAHFLIVWSDGKGGLNSEIRFLPDLTRKRAVDPYAWFAKNNTTLTFSNGMLTGNKSVIDETVIPKAALAAFQQMQVAKLAAALTVDDKTGVYLPDPKIYKIAIGDRGELKLLEGETRFEHDPKAIGVTLQESDK